MFIIFLIYLTAFGLSTWFGPKVIAVLDRADVKTDITNVDAIAGFLIGIVPVLNIFFVFFGGWILAEITKVLKAEAAGDKNAVKLFNQRLKELNDSSRT